MLQVNPIQLETFKRVATDCLKSSCCGQFRSHFVINSILLLLLFCSKRLIKSKSIRLGFIDYNSDLCYSVCLSEQTLAELLHLFPYVVQRRPWLVGSRRNSLNKRTQRKQPRRRNLKERIRRLQPKQHLSTHVLSAG